MGTRPKLIPPTPEENEAINRGIALDTDNPEWTEDDFANARPAMEVCPEIVAAQTAGKLRVRGPQKNKPVKAKIALRMDPDVVAGLRATGPGWQARVNDVMRDWLKNRAA